MNKYNPLISDTFKHRFQGASLAELYNKDSDAAMNQYDDHQNELIAAADVVKSICYAIDNNGYLPDGVKISLKDIAVTSSQIQQFVEPVIETYVRSSYEPYTNISALFDDINVPKPVEINMKSFGKFDVAEVAEGGTVPMRIFDVGGAGERLALGFKKYGVGVGLTKEAIEADNWGFLKYWLNEAGKAFARNREKKAMVALELKAQTLMDNNGTSLIGPTRGRGISGAFNGTITPADLALAIAYGQMRDINFDTVLMNPMAWMMFKLYFGANTGTQMPGDANFYKPKRGKAAPGWPSSSNKFFKEAPGKFGNTSMGNDPIGLLYNGTPNFAMYGATFEDDIFNVGSPLNIMISPWVPYKQVEAGGAIGKFYTNLYLLDSENVGAFFNKYGPTISEWDDKSNDSTFWKVIEAFGIGVYNRGIGIGAIRNIIIDTSYDFKYTYNISSAPAEYPVYEPGGAPNDFWTNLFS